MTVTKIIEGQTYGYKASNEDGVLKQEPHPCVAVKGTHIMVELFFYNMGAHRTSFKILSNKYTCILDVIGCYVIQKINVIFSYKKKGDGASMVGEEGFTQAHSV